MKLFVPLMLAVVSLPAFSPDAQGGMVEYLASGTSAGVPVTSQATFTTSAGQIALTLKNTTIHTADAAQLLTGIRFTLAPDLTSVATLTAASAIPRNISPGGSYTDGVSQSLLGTWQTTLNAGVYQLDFTPNAEFALVGPADGETATTAGLYHANGSIEGNAGHNPFTAKTATFVFSNSGITDTTSIANVAFIYNTGLSNVIPGTLTPPPPPAVPEPSTALFGLALMGASALVRSRKPDVR